MEIYCRAGQATSDNMANAHCMLDYKSNTHTHICNTYLSHCNSGCKTAPLCYIYTYIFCLVYYQLQHICWLLSHFSPQLTLILLLLLRIRCLTNNHLKSCQRKVTSKFQRWYCKSKTVKQF